MADKVSMALAELVRKAEANGDVDFLKEGVRVLSQALMDSKSPSTSGPSDTNVAASGAGSATGTASAPGTRVLARWS